MLKNTIHNVGAVVLAAGKGTRLGVVDKPKVMLEIGGKPIVAYVVETLERLGFPPNHICMVVGFQEDVVRAYFGDRVTYARQVEQRGTADAAYVGMRALPEETTDVLVVQGDDSAFYTPETLEHFIAMHLEKDTVLSLLSAEVEHPESLGRIVRHPDGSIEVIEKEYATEEQKKIKEISTGTFCFDRAWFESIFPDMPPLRKLGEYGLPTALAIARSTGAPHQIVQLENNREWFGVNTPEDLEEARKRNMQ